MRLNDIIDLQEISPDLWRAKYQGNYGVYTIKITLDPQGETSDFSCSCPSSSYPCKHISIVEEAIAGRIAESRRSAETKEKALTIEELLKDVSLQELRNFIARQAKYNSDLRNAVQLEFTHKLSKANTNPYSSILREALKKLKFDYEDYYEYEEGFDVDVLSQWLKKAQAYAEQKNYREALLISQACIEEFAEWLQMQDTELQDCLDPSYQSVPFEIMRTAHADSGVDSQKLYDYCLSEMDKDKYSGIDMFEEFNDLLAVLAAQINPDAFIALQDNLLKKVSDKSSWEAEDILKRKIDFYNSIQQPEKANALIEKNIQIENFRYQLAEKRFSEQNFTEAKNLINDFLSKKNNAGNYYNQRWNELLLQIAQKEKDIPSVQTLAFSFIDRSFDKKYYTIYKSTFTPGEWNDALENILQHYGKNNRNFSHSVADVLVAEKAAEQLMLYVEKHLTAEIIEQYHKAFVALYPEKTLEMFRKAVDVYAEKNTGRNYYEYIAVLLKQMQKIKNGNITVAEMISTYRVKYKNRRAMMEILNKLSK